MKRFMKWCFDNRIMASLFGKEITSSDRTSDIWVVLEARVWMGRVWVVREHWIPTPTAFLRRKKRNHDDP